MRPAKYAEKQSIFAYPVWLAEVAIAGPLAAASAFWRLSQPCQQMYRSLYPLYRRLPPRTKS